MKRIHYRVGHASGPLCGTHSWEKMTNGFSDAVTCLRCLFKMPLLHDERMARMQAVRSKR